MKLNFNTTKMGISWLEENANYVLSRVRRQDVSMMSLQSDVNGGEIQGQLAWTNKISNTVEII